MLNQKIIVHLVTKIDFLKYSKNGNYGQLSVQLPAQMEKALKRIRFKALHNNFQSSPIGLPFAKFSFMHLLPSHWNIKIDF